MGRRSRFPASNYFEKSGRFHPRWADLADVPRGWNTREELAGKRAKNEPPAIPSLPAAPKFLSFSPKAEDISNVEHDFSECKRETVFVGTQE